MQDISQDTLNESAKLAQSARITLWEIDLTQSGGDRYFFFVTRQMKRGRRLPGRDGNMTFIL